jgi:hypothetical protein
MECCEDFVIEHYRVLWTAMFVLGVAALAATVGWIERRIDTGD